MSDKNHTKNAKTDTISVLEARIKQLEKENANLKNTLDDDEKAKRPWNWLINTMVILSIVFAITGFMFFNISTWLKNTIIDDSTFVSTMQPVLRNKPVQERIQKDITNALFERVDVEAELLKVLPENIAFLSAPLANQVETTVSEKVGEIVASDQVYAIWGRTLERVHENIISYVNNKNADGIITVEEVYENVVSRISSDSKLGFLTNKELPPRIGSITLAEIQWLPEVRTHVNRVTYAPLLFLFITAISAIVAIVLSIRKRRTILTIAGLLFVMMISTLAALQIGLWQINRVAEPQNVALAQSIFTTITNPLEQRTQGYAALFLVIFVVTLAVSKVKWIVFIRKYIHNKIIKFTYYSLPKQSLPKWLVDADRHINAIAWFMFVLSFVLTGLRFPPEYTQIRDGFISAIIVTIVLYLVHIYIRSASRK